MYIHELILNAWTSSTWKPDSEDEASKRSKLKLSDCRAKSHRGNFKLHCLHKHGKRARRLHAGCTAEAAATLTRLSPLRQHVPSLLLPSLCLHTDIRLKAVGAEESSVSAVSRFDSDT